MCFDAVRSGRRRGRRRVDLEVTGCGTSSTPSGDHGDDRCRRRRPAVDVGRRQVFAHLENLRERASSTAKPRRRAVGVARRRPSSASTATSTSTPSEKWSTRRAGRRGAPPTTPSRHRRPIDDERYSSPDCQNHRTLPLTIHCRCMNRRDYLALTGTALTTAVAGCSGSGDGSPEEAEEPNEPAAGKRARTQRRPKRKPQIPTPRNNQNPNRPKRSTNPRRSRSPGAVPK